MIVRCRPVINGLGLYRKLFRFQQNGRMTLLMRYSSDRSKVEETLQMLKEDLECQRVAEEKKKMKAVVELKPPITTRIVNEIKHYYHGFRLLALETRLSTRYIWRLARGFSLTRRERQQLIRTVSDLLRLLPFSFFIIVPFMELALPLFIKLFPGMLPSTFQEASKEEERLRRQVTVKIEMAKFLQDTLEEIALERKSKANNTEIESKAYEFLQFLRKVRNDGGFVSNADLFKYTKLFEDELTLDSLTMSQLRALCRILGVAPFGTPEILRFQLKMKLRDLKADDKLIAAEGGVEALSVQEVQSACRARGMRAVGVDEQRLRNQLKQWLELSLSDKVPPSLLLLSRAMCIPEEISFTQRLRTILSILPYELGERTRQKLTELEGGTVDPKERLKLIRNIEEGLKKERMDSKKRKADEKMAKQLEEEKSAVVAEIKASSAELKDHAEFSNDIFLTSKSESEEEIAKSAKVKEAKQKVDKQVLESLENIIHGSHIQEAKHDIIDLKKKVIEHTEDLIKVDSLGTDYTEAKIAKRLRARVNSMISGMDTLVEKLESERCSIKEEVKDLYHKTSDNDSFSSLQVESTEQNNLERLVKINDLLKSLNKLQKVTDQATINRLEEILVALDVDTDGKVETNIVLEVLELLNKYNDVEISAAELVKIFEVFKKEDVIEALEGIQFNSPLTGLNSTKKSSESAPLLSLNSKKISGSNKSTNCSSEK